MKTRILLLFCMTCLGLSYVSARNVVIHVAVAVRSGQPFFDDNSSRVLASNMRAAMSSNGIMSDGYSGIVVCPSLDLVGKNVIEGGMRSIIVFDFQLTLTMLHTITGAEFASMTVPLRGEGYSESGACVTAIRKISPDDKRIAGFLETGCERVADYYRDNISSIITMAQVKVSMKQYGEALALLSSFPSSLDGYSRVADEMKKVYAMWQLDVCGQIMQQARNAYAVGDYDTAVELLGEVDMQGSCAVEAKALAADIKKSIDKERADELQIYNKLIDIEVDLEKQRLKTIENVAKAYYKRQDNYVYLVW